jgi:hypothetical protein
VTDGIVHIDDEDDIAVAVILDSKLKKGHIEFRKVVTQEDMEFLLLSSLGEIEDLRWKVKVGLAKRGASGGSRDSDEIVSGDIKGLLDVANSALSLVNMVMGGGGL